KSKTPSLHVANVMQTQAPNLTNGPTQNRINTGLKRYAESLEWRRDNRRLLGEGVDPDYCLTDFLHCIGAKQFRRLAKAHQAERTKAPLGEVSGPAGGYLVPTELRLDLMQDVAEDALIRKRATVVDMTSARTLVSLPDAGTAQSAATSPFFGGIKMQWTEEGVTRPETEPALPQL